MAIALLLFHILGALSSVHAIMSTRTSQGAVAWVVSLNTLPFVAVPAYWVLGRNKFQGYVTARKLIDEELVQVADMLEEDFAQSRKMQPGEFRDKPFWFGFAARAARLTAPIL